MEQSGIPAEDVGTARGRLARIRVDGGITAAFRRRDGRTVPSRIAEADGYRIRFTTGSPGACEGVLVNTGGGIAGGDRVRFDCQFASGSDVCLTSVSAERVYRTQLGPAHVDMSFDLAEAARCVWLPQETILYAGSQLVRTIRASLAPSSSLTLVDIVVLGRRGAGERMTEGLFRDRWSISRGGRLVHLEAMRLSGAIDAVMAQPACGNGTHVIATLLHVAPDAEDKREAVRSALTAASSGHATAVRDIAVSAWDGKLVVRALGSSTETMRHALAAAATVLTARAMPRSWQL